MVALGTEPLAVANLLFGHFYSGFAGAGGAREGSAGSPAGQPRWGTRQGQAPERAAPWRFAEHASRAEGARRFLDVTKSCRTPSSVALFRARSASNRNQGLRAQALAPAWHPSRAAP